MPCQTCWPPPEMDAMEFKKSRFEIKAKAVDAVRRRLSDVGQSHTMYIMIFATVSQHAAIEFGSLSLVPSQPTVPTPQVYCITCEGQSQGLVALCRSLSSLHARLSTALTSRCSAGNEGTDPYSSPYAAPITFLVAHPLGSYHTPVYGYLLVALGSYNHKVGYPKKGLWYEPTGLPHSLSTSELKTFLIHRAAPRAPAGSTHKNPDLAIQSTWKASGLSSFGLFFNEI